jgi:hypothetical protein
MHNKSVRAAICLLNWLSSEQIYHDARSLAENTRRGMEELMVLADSPGTKCECGDHNAAPQNFECGMCCYPGGVASCAIVSAHPGALIMGLSGCRVASRFRTLNVQLERCNNARSHHGYEIPGDWYLQLSPYAGIAKERSCREQKISLISESVKGVFDWHHVSDVTSTYGEIDLGGWTVPPADVSPMSRSAGDAN